MIHDTKEVFMDNSDDSRGPEFLSWLSEQLPYMGQAQWEEHRNSKDWLRYHFKQDNSSVDLKYFIHGYKFDYDGITTVTFTNYKSLAMLFKLTFM